MPSLTLYFVVQPPKYLYMSCHLAASIREYLPPEVELIGYCPLEEWGNMKAEPLEALRRLRCKIKPINPKGRFDPDYPHGNKILAAEDPKTTDYSAFLDSDMLFLKPCSIEELVAPGKIGMVPSTSMRWAPQSVWDDIYGEFGMKVPEERIHMTRDKRTKVVPYFNAGLFVIDENHRSPDGRRFVDVWMETAQQLDKRSDIDNKRPYLDQMTLPVATLRAGMQWNILPEKYNYSIGGILRGKKLDKNADITLLHYRNRDVLAEAGCKRTADNLLASQLGTRLVRWIFKVPLPGELAKNAEGADAKPESVNQIERADGDKPDATPDDSRLAQTESAASTETRQESAQSPEVKSEEAASVKDATPAKSDALPEDTKGAEGSGAVPDPSKAMMAAVTVAGDDTDALQNWIGYYKDQIGAKNLYVLCTKKTARIEDIAAGCNLVPVPEPSTREQTLGLLSSFVSGLTLYYNWVLACEVDEFLTVDPEVSRTLPDYLAKRVADGEPPRLTVPLGMVAKGADTQNGLHVQLSSEQTKPCLTRGRLSLSENGRASNVKSAVVDPQLVLIKDATNSGAKAATPSAEVSALPDLSMPRIRASIATPVQLEASGHWAQPSLGDETLYELPDRVRALFGS